MNYLNNFKEGKGLYIYVKHDFIYYLEKVKLLCNLNNYEAFIIDESKEEAKFINRFCHVNHKSYLGMSF